MKNRNVVIVAIIIVIVIAAVVVVIVRMSSAPAPTSSTTTTPTDSIVAGVDNFSINLSDTAPSLTSFKFKKGDTVNLKFSADSSVTHGGLVITAPVPSNTVTLKPGQTGTMTFTAFHTFTINVAWIGSTTIPRYTIAANVSVFFPS